MTLYDSDIFVIIYKPSNVVLPELAYNIAVDNSMKHEEKEPNKKYVSPADVADSEFLYIEVKMYKP